MSSQTNVVEKRSHFTTLKSQKEPWNYLAGLRLLGSGWQAARLWRETALFYLRDSSESCQEFHQVTRRRQSGPQRNLINRWVNSFSSAADPSFPSGVVTRPHYRVLIAIQSGSSTQRLVKTQKSLKILSLSHHAPSRPSLILSNVPLGSWCIHCAAKSPVYFVPRLCFSLL